tara:strand:+ start:379 stop:603 length:225 start_codon:yes stop_codon:yes gene_type:complete
MGKGLEMGSHGVHKREDLEMLEDFRDQLLLALVKKYGPEISITAAEVDATGGHVLNMTTIAETRTFLLKVEQKN